MKVCVFLFFCFCAINLNGQIKESSEKILNDAFKEADANNKNVLIVFTASWCINCHALKMNLLDDTSYTNLKKIFSDNYVIRYLVANEHPEKKDLETPGASDLFLKYGKGNVSLPFFVVLDKKGNLLADSIIRLDGANLESSGENMGRPYMPDEVDAFIKVLKKTGSFSRSDLETIKKKCNPKL